jgi:SAM-dependent methyltransferase
MMTWFWAANRRLARRIETWLPREFNVNLARSYERIVAAELNKPESGRVVVDVGGGKFCPYLRFIDPAREHRFMAADIALDELRRNDQIKDRVVTDVVLSMPFADGSIDVLTSRSAVEHLSDVERYLTNCARGLRPGGYIIHSFPCRFAPFSLINQILPNKFARRLLHLFQPQWRDECGFPAYYNHCYYSAIRRLLERHRFTLTHVEMRYYQSIYYDFFLPLFILMVAYDLCVWKVQAKNLACQMLFVAQYRADATATSHDIPLGDAVERSRRLT